MAIVTDQTITIHGVQVGISKPIMQLISTGDFTYDELSKFAFVGRHDFINDFIGIYASELQETGSASSLLAKNKYPVMNDPAGAWSNIKYLYTGKGERPHDAYGKMVLVYNRTSSASAIQNNYSDSNSACIVTDINPRLLKMIPNIIHSTVTATYGESGTYDIYDAEASINIKWYDDNSTAPFSTLCVQKYDEYQYFTFPLYDNRATSTEVISGNAGGTKARMYYMNDAFNRPGNKYISPWAQTDDIDDFASGASYSSTWNCVNKVNTDRANRNLILKYRGNPYYEGTVYVKAADLDAILKQCAGCGLYFEYNSTIYKPVVEDGIVTGYTDDLIHNSEWDLINDVTGNTVPDAPPSPTPPTPSGDDIDSNSFGGGSKLGGVDNVWLLTAQQLSDLHTAFNNNSDPDFEPLNSIISVLGLAISPLYIFGDDITTVTNITIKKADGTSWSSGVNGHICSSQVSSFGLTGNISIQRKYNNFLDYPPYASHEMFIPLCGWVPLPSCCVGRTLSVYYVPDIQTGGVRGLVLCDGCIVAEKYGILGANIPFTSNGHGLMLGGIISGGVQTLADFATAMGGLATGNAMATVYGGSSFFSDGFNMALAANQNRTSVIGQNQDRTGFSDGTYIRIKSVYQDVKIDPLFGHTIGYMCHESGELNDFHGFTVCENPHVHISATSTEKEEIKQLLEQGVILP